MSSGSNSKKAGRKPGSKNLIKPPKITDQSLTISEISQLNTRMYNNRKYFMDLYDKYGKYDHVKFKRLIARIDKNTVSLPNYEVAIIRMMYDITRERNFDQEKYANIFITVLQFMSGDVTGLVDYQIAPQNILDEYRSFCKKNKKSIEEFKIDFDMFAMFVCSEPGVWNDSAFRVVKLIGDWMLKQTLHHASSLKLEQFGKFMDVVKDILIDRIGTKHPETFAAVAVDLKNAMETVDWVDKSALIKDISPINDNAK